MFGRVKPFVSAKSAAAVARRVSATPRVIEYRGGFVAVGDMLLFGNDGRVGQLVYGQRGSDEFYCRDEAAE